MAKKKTSQNELAESANKIWLAGLGAFAVAEEEGSKVFKTLVKKGEGFERRSKKQLEKVQGDVEGQVETAREKAEGAWNKLGKSFDEKVSDALGRLGVPSRMEIQKLTKRVEQLTRKVDGLKTRKTTPVRKTRTRKTA
ncbi:MAG: phasin family protein [Acidobacteriota bacterium]|nr:phasin family protein [Acidobacteriota bacterium]